MYTQTAPVLKKMRWAGLIVSGFAVLFLLFDSIMKVVKPAFIVEANAQFGYPVSTVPGIGILLIVCTVVYVIPRAAVLGAILLTGYLGAAVATRARRRGPVSSSLPCLFWRARLGRALLAR